MADDENQDAARTVELDRTCAGDRRLVRGFVGAGSGAARGRDDSAAQGDSGAAPARRFHREGADGAGAERAQLRVHAVGHGGGGRGEPRLLGRAGARTRSGEIPVVARFAHPR